MTSTDCDEDEFIDDISTLIQKSRDYDRILKPTGLCYDHRMRAHTTVNVLDHHPEDPRRILRAFQLLVETKYASKHDYEYTVNELDSSQESPSQEVIRIAARSADLGEISLVHNETYLRYILSTAHMTCEQLLEAEKHSDSLYFNSESSYCALLSCGSSVETCLAVARGHCKNALALVRPPGHHAEPQTPGGFCLLSNVAIAAQSLLKSCPDTIKKILILDWDVHHGNGTQKAFYSNPNVLYVSLHRYENGEFYPGTSYGNMDKIGEGEGAGFSVNVPWPRNQMHDGDYLYAFLHLIMPIAHEFDPDFVIVSAGFDAAVGDEIGECLVTPEGYAHMLRNLQSLANGKVAVILEGGYNLDSVALSVFSCFQTLLGKPPKPLSYEYRLPSDSAIVTVQKCIKHLSPYWQSLYPKHINTKRIPTDLQLSLHDASELAYSAMLNKKFRMIRLNGFSSAIGNAQIHFSNDYTSCEAMTIIARRETVSLSSEVRDSNKLNLHKSFIISPFDPYLRWSADHSRSIIEVKLPDKNTCEIPNEDILSFVFDKIVSNSSAKNIALLTEGTVASRTLMRIISDRPWCYSKVKTMAQFNDADHLSISLPKGISQNFNDWADLHTIHYVSQNTKIMKHTYGRLIESPFNLSCQMTHKHFNAVISYIAQQEYV